MQGDSIQLATKALNENSVVGIPTETVYGIGVKQLKNCLKLKKEMTQNLSLF